MAKKTKKTARTKARAAKASRSPRAETTEIVFSYAEIDFLRKITKKPIESSSGRDRAARLSLRDKLLDINFGRPNAGGAGLIVLQLDRPEVNLLQRLTKELYSFITAEERRARLILREKILIAVEKLTGRKIALEVVS